MGTAGGGEASVSQILAKARLCGFCVCDSSYFLLHCIHES